jgi:hypothetical protein
MDMNFMSWGYIRPLPCYYLRKAGYKILSVRRASKRVFENIGFLIDVAIQFIATLVPDIGTVGMYLGTFLATYERGIVT